MKTIDMGEVWKKLAKYKYVALVVALGLVLILLPGGGNTSSGAEAPSDVLAATGVPLTVENGNLSTLLTQISGVGRVQVLLSNSGAVIVCDGADSAQARLNVTNAVMAYTGLGSDKISVMKMK